MEHTTTYRMIHKVWHVSIETSVDSEVTVFSVIVIEIKEIRHSLCVVDLPSTFRLFTCDHLNRRTPTNCRTFTKLEKTGTGKTASNQYTWRIIASILLSPEGVTVQYLEFFPYLADILHNKCSSLYFLQRLDSPTSTVTGSEYSELKRQYNHRLTIQLHWNSCAIAELLKIQHFACKQMSRSHLDFPAFLHDPVGTVRATFTEFVALVDGRAIRDS